MSRRAGIFLFTFLLGVGLSQAAHATIIDVVIDTSPLDGVIGNLAFDLIDSNPGSNTVTILDFATDGVLGAASGEPPGAVSGALPGLVTISDVGFFNELLQGFAFGTSLSFSVDVSEAFTAGDLSDSFSFFLLDDDAVFPLPLFATTDPSGADALFAFDIDGTSSGRLFNFVAMSVPPQATWTVRPRSTGVPEPPTVLSLAVGFVILAFRRRQQQKLDPAS